jgi:hypothetical protein
MWEKRRPCVRSDSYRLGTDFLGCLRCSSSIKQQHTAGQVLSPNVCRMVYGTSSTFLVALSWQLQVLFCLIDFSSWDHKFTVRSQRLLQWALFLLTGDKMDWVAYRITFMFVQTWWNTQLKSSCKGSVTNKALSVEQRRRADDSKSQE